MELHLAAWIIAGIFTIIAFGLSTYLIMMHFIYFTRPLLQKPIIRILALVPIFVVDSWFSLRFKDASLYFDLIRDAYEAYVIYQFFVLLVAFINTYQYEDSADAERLIDDSKGILQFVVIKPLGALFAVVMNLLGVYGDERLSQLNRGYFYKTIVDNISITLAMYFLVLFYQATKIQLKPFNPVAKFLCIKLVVFFTFWQAVGIAILSYLDVIRETPNFSQKDVDKGLQDFLICIEMVPIAVLHAYAFGYKTYRDPESEPLLGKGRGGSGLLRELKPIAKNVGQVFNPKDVVEDAVEVFGIGDGARAVGRKMEETEEKVRDVIRAKTVKGDRYEDLETLHRVAGDSDYQEITTDLYSHSDSEDEDGGRRV